MSFIYVYMSTYMYVKSLQGIPSRQIITLHVIRTEAAFTCLYKSTRTTRSVTNKEPGGTRRDQEKQEPGGEGEIRRDQEGPGGTRRDQEPLGTRRNQEGPGGGRRKHQEAP